MDRDKKCVNVTGSVAMFLAAMLIIGHVGGHCRQCVKNSANEHKRGSLQTAHSFVWYRCLGRD